MDTKGLKFTDCTPDELRELYEKEAELFDELADDAIRQACIGRTPEQTLKLRQLQWSIDGQLRRAKTPVERMRVMENIFYGQVYGDDGQLAKLASACASFVRAINGTARGTVRISGKKPEIRLLKQ